MAMGCCLFKAFAQRLGAGMLLMRVHSVTGGYGWISPNKFFRSRGLTAYVG